MVSVHFVARNVLAEKVTCEKWTRKAPDCKSLVYSSNELYLLDSPNNCIKIFAKGKQWSYFRSISPSGMHVSKFILTLLNSRGTFENRYFTVNPKRTAYYISSLSFIFQEMRGLALSPDNNLYISNCWSHSILRVHKKSADTTLLADRKSFFQKRFPGYIDVDDGCWRRNVLVTTLRCLWRFWPFLSPTSSIFYHWRRPPTTKRCHQYRNSVTNIHLSPTFIEPISQVA